MILKKKKLVVAVSKPQRFQFTLLYIANSRTCDPSNRRSCQLLLEVEIRFGLNIRAERSNEVYFTMNGITGDRITAAQ